MKFLESKIVRLELALESSVQDEQRCEEEDSNHNIMKEAGFREEMKRNVEELEEMLRICKRRITEQNEDNAILRAQVIFMMIAIKIMK